MSSIRSLRRLPVLLALAAWAQPPEASLRAAAIKPVAAPLESRRALANVDEEVLARQERIEGSTGEPTLTSALELTREEVPFAMRSCFGCHAGVVAAFLGSHGMAKSIGTVGSPETGVVVNPRNQRRYEITSEADGPWLTTTATDGGRRRQRLVGRIGAGIFTTSWVTAETDPATGVDSGRLFFAPVETIADRGLMLAPFEHHEEAPGPDMELTQGCLTCHATRRLSELAGAATGGGGTVYPANALGADAFEGLGGIGCDGCHGDAGYHQQLVAGQETGIGSGMIELGALPAASQRDVCARCHLQGDSRWELVDAAPSTGIPLPAQIPVLVPGEPDQDFRFVGQLERLELSACFRASPRMTCTTCHDPHLGAPAQGVAAFDASCLACHRDRCDRPPELTVVEVTGALARGALGCVDCHLRRSQPFDLAEIRSVDHWIRRRIERPQSGADHRQFADRQGPLRLFDRQRLADSLQTPGGRTWEHAVLAMGLATMGRFEEAGDHFAALPRPGTAGAVAPVAPAPLLSVLDRPSLHQTRGLTLLAAGRFEEAVVAFSDALRLDPLDPPARLARARLALDRGDVRGVLEDTQVVIDTFPRAEQPWRLRLELAERAGRLDLAQRALEAITERWPSDPVAWQKLGLLLEQQGERAGAAAALRRARLLRPSLDLRPAPREPGPR